MAVDEKRSNLIKWIMLAVLVWGSLLAVGSALFGPDPETGRVALEPNLWRGVIVMGCVLFFLGGWVLLLTRSRRVES
jgi:hypothetical protein